MTRKEEVIAAFCHLATRVGNDVFKNEFAHDCFCGQNFLANHNFQFDEKIINFISEAIDEKIAKGK